MTDQLLARPYAFEQVRERLPQVERTFEWKSGAGVPETLLESARDEARAAGYAAGWAQGLQQAREEMASHVERSAAQAAALDAERSAALASAVNAVAAAAERLEQQAVPSVARLEETVVAMAIEIAEMIVGHDLATNPRTGLDALKRVLQLTPQDEAVVVELSSADHAAVIGSAEFEEWAGLRPITVRPSAELLDGDAIARCGATEIDARVGPALVRVKEFLDQ